SEERSHRRGPFREVVRSHFAPRGLGSAFERPAPTSGGFAVLWARLTPGDDVERDDEVLAVVERGEVGEFPGLVARHPRAAARRRHTGGLLLEGASELGLDVELHKLTRAPADLVEDEGVDPVLDHLDIGAEAIRV